MLGQVNLFVPAEDQLPYAFLYNCYYKRVGIRTGLGLNSSETQTEIEGQALPRVTNVKNTHWRLGLTYQLVNYKRVSVNGFVDYIYQKEGLESSTTTTIQTFPNPVTTRTVKSVDMSNGKGLQGGFGVMLHFNKHLSLYTEAPLTWLVEDRRVEDLVRESGEDDISTSSHTYTSGIKIALPVTIYLVFRI